MGKYIITLGTKISTNIIRKMDNTLYYPPLMSLWNKISTLYKKHKGLVEWEALWYDTKNPHTHAIDGRLDLPQNKYQQE